MATIFNSRFVCDASTCMQEKNWVLDVTRIRTADWSRVNGACPRVFCLFFLIRVFAMSDSAYKRES